MTTMIYAMLICIAGYCSGPIPYAADPYPSDDGTYPTKQACEHVRMMWQRGERTTATWHCFGRPVSVGNER
jgi:hypothetical protein